MLQQINEIQESGAVFAGNEPGIEEEHMIDDRQVFDILDRASHDNEFWKDLMENGSKALEHYNISIEARAAIVSGDIKWIERKVGAITDEQARYLYHRLQVERW